MILTNERTEDDVTENVQAHLERRRRSLKLQYDQQTDAFATAHLVHEQADVATWLAHTAALLADNSRRLAELHSDRAQAEYAAEMRSRYGDAWTAKHKADVWRSAANQAGKDLWFKEYAAANEMYNRWATMYATLAQSFATQLGRNR